MGNDTYNADDRAAAATEVDGIFNQVVGSLNTRFGDRYIFGGYVDNTPPFAADGTYQGTQAYARSRWRRACTRTLRFARTSWPREWEAGSTFCRR